ncbi:UDP-glucose 4-epimerase [subsurface metagenome]
MEGWNKVLVTGATGFVGSHLTRKLIEEGFKVGIIKRERSDIWGIKDLLDKIVAYDVDLRGTQDVSKAVSHFRPDVIFHLATYYAVDHKSQEIPLMVDTNVLGAVNLLEASKESMVKLFINTSSCFVYKESKDKLRENADLSPLNLYALTKMQAEEACTFYVENYGLKTITFRLFPPYGPADHARRLIPYVIKSLLDGKRLKLTIGKQRWDFVYVDDIVEAYLKLLFVSDLPQTHQIFNIGAGNAVSVREVVSRIKEIIGTDIEPDWGAIPHRRNEVWFTCADISKVETVLDWRPKIQILGEGLELTVKWYVNFWEMGGRR